MRRQIIKTGEQSDVINQVAHGFTVGQPVFFNGTWNAAIADNSGSAGTHVIREVVDVDNFYLAIANKNYTVDFTTLMEGGAPAVVGNLLYVSAITPGTYTHTEPAVESNPIAEVQSANELMYIPYRPVKPIPLREDIDGLAIGLTTITPTINGGIIPSAESIMVYRQNLLIREGATNDYTIVGNDVVLASPTVADDNFSLIIYK